MKSKIIFSFLICSLLLAGKISVAEIPSTGCNDDSVATTDYSGLISPFRISPDATLPVNEGEIRAGLLFDAVDKRIVWQKDMTSIYPIASLTKMMVALLTVEDVKAGKIQWTDNVKWTRETYVGSRRHRKKVCSVINYSVRDVFKAAMIASNNECAEQLAIFLAQGQLQVTIDRMNARAHELGMNSTYYGNPTGLPAPHSMFDNSSTPSDLLLLSLEMLKYNEVIEIASMGYASIENGKSTSVIRNHNGLTIDFSGEVDGLKTGYTKRAGFCLVATTAKCDHRLVSIVLGCRGPQLRNEIVRDMVNNYYTSIGLDPLGPNCISPLNIAQKTESSGNYMTVSETVKKLHLVKKGESLSLIASKYNCTSAQLKSWNKKSIQHDRVLSGSRLAVYVKQNKKVFIANPANGSESDDDKPLISEDERKTINKEAAEADSNENVATVEKVAPHPTTYLYHTVAPGDTLFNIAKRYEGISVDELKELNKISDIRSLKPGTKLKIKIQG